MDFGLLDGDEHWLENLQIKETITEDPGERESETHAIVEGCESACAEAFKSKSRETTA